MPIKILLAVPKFNSLDRLTKTLQSIASSTRIPDRVLLINNVNQVTDAYRSKWSRCFEMDMFTPVLNLGVSGSANYALRNIPNEWWWMHVNDDVKLNPKCIQYLAEVAGLSSKYADFNRADFLVPEHDDNSPLTVFLSRNLRGIVGYFSEIFNSRYLENSDYGHRMNLAGVQRTVVQGATYTHHAALRRSNTATLPEYERMWGGPPEHETFDAPYNGSFGHDKHMRHTWAVYEAPKEVD